MWKLGVPLIILSLGCNAFAQRDYQYARSAGTLLIDNSGSMEKADPKGLHVDAIAIFHWTLELEGADATGEVLYFDSTVHETKPSKRGSLTNTVSALDKAYARLENSGLVSDEKYVILISDGEIDVDKPTKENPNGKSEPEVQSYKALINNTIPQYINKGIQIHTICLIAGKPRLWKISEEAPDTGEDLLRLISDRTGGDAYTVSGIGDLIPAMWSIRLKIPPRPTAHTTTEDDGTFQTLESDKMIIVTGPKGTEVEPMYPKDVKLDIESIDKGRMSAIKIKNPKPAILRVRGYNAKTDTSPLIIRFGDAEYEVVSPRSRQKFWKGESVDISVEIRCLDQSESFSAVLKRTKIVCQITDPKKKIHQIVLKQKGETALRYDHKFEKTMLEGEYRYLIDFVSPIDAAAFELTKRQQYPYHTTPEERFEVGQPLFNMRLLLGTDTLRSEEDVFNGGEGEWVIDGKKYNTDDKVQVQLKKNTKIIDQNLSYSLLQTIIKGRSFPLNGDGTAYTTDEIQLDAGTTYIVVEVNIAERKDIFDHESQPIKAAKDVSRTCKYRMIVQDLQSAPVPRWIKVVLVIVVISVIGTVVIVGLNRLPQFNHDVHAYRGSRRVDNFYLDKKVPEGASQYEQIMNYIIPKRSYSFGFSEDCDFKLDGDGKGCVKLSIDPLGNIWSAVLEQELADGKPTGKKAKLSKTIVRGRTGGTIEPVLIPIGDLELRLI